MQTAFAAVFCFSGASTSPFGPCPVRADKQRDVELLSSARRACLLLLLHGGSWAQGRAGIFGWSGCRTDDCLGGQGF